MGNLKRGISEGEGYLSETVSQILYPLGVSHLVSKLKSAFYAFPLIFNKWYPDY